MDLGSLFVLLVEPSSTQKKIIANYLKEIGIEHIEYSNNGNEALQSMLNHKPDLVICAMYLSDMTGHDLVIQMRHDEEFKEIAFMLATSETNFRILDPIRQAGATAMLPKPFKKDDLRMALNATVDYLDPGTLKTQHYELDEMQVLIVDDSATARKFIRLVLEKMGIRNFTEAEDGQQAIEILQHQFFDMVVTDYNMPNVDGGELVSHIRNSSSQQSVPILMVTSEQNEGRLAAIQQAGVSAVCDKPFETSNVKQVIEQMFSD